MSDDPKMDLEKMEHLSVKVCDLVEKAELPCVAVVGILQAVVHALLAEMQAREDEDGR